MKLSGANLTGLPAIAAVLVLPLSAFAQTTIAELGSFFASA